MRIVLREYETAIAEFDEVLALFDSVEVSVRLRVETMAARALVLGFVRRNVESRRAYREALSLAEASFGLTNPFVLETLVSLGERSAVLGELEEAKQWMDAATIRGGLAFGVADQHAAARHTRAGTYFALVGDPLLSAEHSREALRLNDEAFEPNLYARRTALGNLCGALASASPLDALEPCTRGLGFDDLHDDPAFQPAVVVNLGVACVNLQRFEEAAHYFRLALTTMTVRGKGKTFGSAILRANLGEIAELSDDAAAAEVYYRRSLALMDTLLPPGNARVAFPLTGLARAVWALGDGQEAVSLTGRALQLKGKPGLNPVYLADAKALLAEIWLTQNTNKAKARKLAAEALAYYETMDDRGTEKAAALREFLAAH